MILATIYLYYCISYYICQTNYINFTKPWWQIQLNMSLVDVLIVGVGSSFGGMTRFLLSKLVQTETGGVFPWGTLTVNMLGCLAIGVIYGVLDREGTLSHGMRLFLTVGFCGGFTTFSTFIHESHVMFGNSGVGMLAGYIILSTVGGLLLTYIGYSLIKLF